MDVSRGAIKPKSAVYSTKTLKEGGEDAVGMVMAIAWHPDVEDLNPELNFAGKSKDLWGAPVNWATAMSYNAAKAMIEALRQETNPSRAGIQKQLMASTFSVNGVSGEFKFSQTGHAGTLAKFVEVRSDNRSAIGYSFVPVR